MVGGTDDPPGGRPPGGSAPSGGGDSTGGGPGEIDPGSGGSGGRPPDGSPVTPGGPPDAAAYADPERSEAFARYAVRGIVRQGDPGLAGLSAIFTSRTLPGPMQLVPVVITTTGAATLVMAFMFLGKRREDGEQPAPDDVLATSAATGVRAVASAALVDGAAGTWPGTRPLPPPLDPEAHLPRWRRPSLMEARKADPLRNQRDIAPLTFSATAALGASTGAGVERRRIRYRLVSLLDRPDELSGVSIGTLDQGDEVQLMEPSGLYWRVLCPTGQEGWLHKMTLGDVILDDVDDWPAEAATANPATAETASDEDAAGLLALYADRIAAMQDRSDGGDDPAGEVSPWDSESVARNGHEGTGHITGDGNGNGFDRSSGDGHADGDLSSRPWQDVAGQPPPGAPSMGSAPTSSDSDELDPDVLMAFLTARTRHQ
jgi:hypothetical protein